MRHTRSRLVRSALLLTVASALQQCGGRADEPPLFQAVATTDQVMDAIIVPSSQAIFDAVVYSNGELRQSPRSDDDWFRLQMHALAVAEAGNLLIMSPRARDLGDWLRLSHAMTTSAETVAKAAEAHDLERLLKTGGELYDACTGCHAKYLPKE